MRQLKFALIALLPLLLTGCWDGRDPEDRAYVITMGIDKGEDGLLVTFAPAKTTEGNDQSVYRVNGDTLTAAVADADSRSSREVYLGQLRTVVFGKSLLADKAAFEAVLEELEGMPSQKKSWCWVQKTPQMPVWMPLHRRTAPRDCFSGIFIRIPPKRWL